MVEWLSYSGRAEARAMPLPRSLANLKREVSEKKWVEVRRRPDHTECQKGKSQTARWPGAERGPPQGTTS